MSGDKNVVVTHTEKSKDIPMDCVDIIEVLSDGRYKLNENQLQSILSKAENCHNFALISIIGAKLSGKSSLMNCFISYLESNQRKSWPKDHIIKCFDGFNKSFVIPKKRVIKMWYKPFIFEEEDNKTAIFLMDSSHVFEYIPTISYTKLVEDIIGLFLTTSSTVIYLKFSYFLTEDLSQLKKASEKCLKDLKTIDSFEELFFVIRDWDPNIKSKFNKYLFGLKNGNNYLKDQFTDHHLDNYFEKIECYLMPASKKSITDDFDFNKLGNDFNFELSKLLTLKLLNVDEMKLKRDPISKALMTTTQLSNIFKSYVNYLNGHSVSIDFGINFQKSDKSVQTVEEPEQTSSDSELLSPEFIAKNEELNERHSKTIDTINDLKKPGDQVVDRVNSYLHNTIFGGKQSESDITKSALFQFGSNQVVNSVTTYASIVYRSLTNNSDSDKNKTADTEKSEDIPMDCQQTDKINDNKGIDFIEVSDDSMNVGTISDNSLDESQMTNYSEFMEIITISDHSVCIHNSVDDSQKVATSYKDKPSDEVIESIPGNEKYITLEETFENYCKKLCIDYKKQITTEINSKDFNMKTDFNQLHRNTKTKILYKFDRKLEKHTKIEKQMIKRYRELLSKQTEELMPDIKNVCQLICEISVKSMNEKESISEPVHKFMVQTFDNCLNNQLKRGFFNKQEVEKAFHKLLDKTVYKLESELMSIKTKTLSNYLRNSKEAQDVIKRARIEAINLYSYLMYKNISEMVSFNSRDFRSISDSNLSEALKHNETLLDSIKYNFSESFYETIFENNIRQIKDNISTEEQTIRQIFLKKCITNPKSSIIAVHFGRQYLFAGIYDKQYNNILDKYGNGFRPNCIAFKNQILCGSDAKEFVKSLGETISQDFDIKNLLLKKKSDLKEEEMNSYPFEFLNSNNNLLRVIIRSESINYDFSIESLISLQFLDIKSDAEQQLSTNIRKAVFTVPTYYTIKEKNAFRDVATIAGLDSVHILSEITAAAIGYAYSVRPQQELNALIISINDCVIEGAIIEMKNRDIKYRCYERETLISEKINWKSKNLWKKKQEQNQTIRKQFEIILEKILIHSSINKRDIDRIILFGASKIYGSVILDSILDIFKDKRIIDCSGTDLIAKGSAIYAKYFMEYNSEFRFDVQEVSFHSLKFQIIENKFYLKSEETVIYLNKLLAFQKMFTFYPPFKYQLPIDIHIFQNERLVTTFQIRSLDLTYLSRRYLKWSHIVSIGLTEFGELKVISKLTANDGQYVIDNQLTENKLIMTAEEVKRDKHNINIIENNRKFKISDE